MSRGSFKALRTFSALVALLFAAGTAEAQQTGTLQGTVVQAATSQPVAGAQVFIPGTRLGTITNTEGRFQLLNVPAGTHTVQVQLIGYTDISREVSVSAGQVMAVNFEIAQAPIALQEVVVTGVAGVTSKAKLPFVVEQLRTEDMPVPAVSAGGMIQGKVAGATVVSGSGRPGSGQSILLRGPTSINASGRSQEPLYIMDGVILSGSFVDFDALDIQNIEIVKGAAAASLYGSRAANGVVHITTNRGRGLGDDQTRFTLRSELGRNQLPKRIATAQLHPYAMNEAGTKFVDKDGNEFDYLEEGELLISPWSSYQRNRWPGKTYDNLNSFFQAGDFGQHSLALEGRSGRTNYLASFSNMHESGVMPGQEGFKRNNFRINLDHGLFDNIQVNATAFYSSSKADQIAENQTSPLFSLTMIPPVIDLGARDKEGRLVPWPDPLRGEELNPLYVNEHRRYFDQRERFLGSGNVRFNPTNWFSADAGVSFDRLTLNRENFYPKGYGDNWDGTEGPRPPSQRHGWLRHDNFVETALNAHFTGTFTQRFGEVNTRTQVRYLYEDQDYTTFYAQGSNFSVDGIPRLTITDPASRGVYSNGETIRSEGVYLLTNFDIRDRYILDAQVRRDGSSLFGPESRWQTYYRMSGAWRVSEEEFFNISGINEFKLRYAYGTAGSKPRFSAQYEVYSVSGGAPSPVTLGNRELKPEFAREQEMGLDMVFLDRFDMSVTYATANIDDQILEVPLRGVAGFGSQWKNAGTLKSNTWEASLGGNLYQGDKFSWNSRVLFDRTRQEITKLDVPCFTYGLPASNPQGFEAAFYACEGEAVGTFYGIDFARSMDQLPAGADRSKFQKNNDGYIVYVGSGNTWRDGESTYTNDAGNEVRYWGSTWNEAGRTYQWGAPIRVLNDEGFEQVRIGTAMPDYNWSFSNTANYGGFTLYTLIDASQGFSVYNRARQWAIRDYMSPVQDQTGPEAEQKPHGYYTTLYAVNNLTGAFVEDGSFIKLREVSLRYNFDGGMFSGIGLSGIDRAAIWISGRNLKTWTDYTGYDPEVGFGGGQAGSAALNRIDSYQYPNYRTWTVGVEIGF
jgi:TonB-linked SusC/RagA family outer membrane protein